MKQVAGDLAGGWWEDLRGFVAGRDLKKRYHEACKALQKANRDLEANIHEEKVAEFALEVDRCIDAVKDIEREVCAVTFA